MFESDPHSMGQATVVNETNKAILVRLEDLGDEPIWIPKSVIHADSEVWDGECQPGELVVKEWWADKNGYA